VILRIVDFALHQRFVVLAFVLLLTVGGIIAFYRLPIEAYPDVADVEVDVITLWPGHAPEEVERHITIPLENELNGIARVTFLRSISNFGLSNIRVLFLDGTDDYWARQPVQERIARAELPTDVKPGLYIIVPLVLFIIFVLLFSTFQSVGDALLIMLNLPFAIIGGTLALYLWGTNFSISAAVGYIAVFGVSVLDGVVLVSFIRQAISEDLGIREAIVRGCEMRFRPIIVTAIVAIIGFLPAALSHGIGAEIQRPLARVVIGGLISATAMTLLVLPAIYELLARRLERRQSIRAATS